MTIKTNCKTCGCEFSWERQPGTRGRLRRFCSDECRKAENATRTRKARNTAVLVKCCVVCQAVFETTFRQKKVCGAPECRAALLAAKARKLNNKPRGKGTCPQCGIEFATTANKKKFCGHECRSRWHYERSDAKVRGDSNRALAEAKKQRNTCLVCGNVRPSGYRGVCAQCSANACRVRSHADGGFVMACGCCGRMVVRKSRRLSPTCHACELRNYRTSETGKAARSRNRRWRDHVKRASGRHGISFDSVDIFNRDGWKCQLCGCKVRPSSKAHNQQDEATVDHIIPLSRGGSHSEPNCQTACRRCNVAKGATLAGQASIEWQDG